MNKKEQYAINGALIGGIRNALINANRQQTALDFNPEWPFNWREFFWETVKGGVLGGAIGYGIGSIVDYYNEQAKPVNTDFMLLRIVNSVKLNPTHRLYIQLREKAEIIIDRLSKEFASELKQRPMLLGSTEKGTALRRNFDIDICLPFRADSFRSTEEMFDCVFEFLKTLIGYYSIIEVRDQKKSIGVILNMDGAEHRIDIVPYKITKKKGNRTAGYLYLNNKSIWASKSSYTKTDIGALKSQKLTETQKKIVVILKHWKHKKNLPISSHLLENLVLDAYQYNYGFIPRKFTGKVIMVLKHIANNLDIAVIRSIENTNNIVTNIPEASKTEIIDACKSVVEKYEYQPNSIVDIMR